MVIFNQQAFGKITESFGEALQQLFGLYYLTNSPYNRKVICTLEFFQRAVLKMATENMRGKAKGNKHENLNKIVALVLNIINT